MGINLIKIHIKENVLEALRHCANNEDYLILVIDKGIENIIDKIYDDLLSFSKKDPAAEENPLYILKTYTSFSAVLHYRIANWVYEKFKDNKIYLSNPFLPALLSRRGKVLSGAEIHFKCKIGHRFILDHGFGTVIGETSIIGDDCYILGGVTLGARKISGNDKSSRHPQIGNRVQIGAHSSLLGSIKIGNDVFIGSNCIITNNIPSGSRVKSTPSIKITHKNHIREESYA